MTARPAPGAGPDGAEKAEGEEADLPALSGSAHARRAQVGWNPEEGSAQT